MDLSGVIFVGLAVAWAVYLIPKAIKMHDEAGRTRSVERFSHSMRVLAHREATSAHEARLVVAPRRPLGAERLVPPAPRVPAEASAEAASATVTTSTSTTTTTTSERTSVTVDAPFHEVVGAHERRRHDRARRVARQAASRRRRVLLGLMLGVVVVVGLAVSAVVPWVATAVPGGLVLVWLVVCRLQVRRLDAQRTARLTALALPVVPAGAASVVQDEVPMQAPAPDYDAVPAFDGEETVALDVAALAAAGRGSVSESSLWDPLPLTLPTYVTKPRAQRSVRRITLDTRPGAGEPGTWSSGHAEADSRLVAEQEAQQAHQAVSSRQGDDTGEQQTAVGS